jgi:probable addiction module antidote protein
MKTETRPFDVAEYLDDPAVIALYLSDAAADPDPDMFIIALSNVARAVGITSIAEKAGLGRESLYKTLAPGAQPRLDTIRRITSAFGLQMQFAPAAAMEQAPIPAAASKSKRIRKAGSKRTKKTA